MLKKVKNWEDNFDDKGPGEGSRMKKEEEYLEENGG